MEALRALSLDLGTPSPQALWVAAQRQGLPVTRRQVFDFAARRAAPQIFREHNQPKGKTASEGANVRWQADLAIMPPRRGFVAFLLVVDVFTRKAWARAVKSKEPHVVAMAFGEILQEARGRDPATVLTDRGSEFGRFFRDDLRREGIEHIGKDVNDRNGTAVLDRTMQTLKRDLAVRDARNPGDWPDRLRPTVSAYNRRFHGAVHDAPNDVATGGIAHFMTLEDNAKKFKHNHDLTMRRLERIGDAGHFRPPIPGQVFAGPRRVAEPRFGDVVSAEGARLPRGRGKIQTRDGRRYLVKAIQPVRMPPEA